MFRLLVAGGRNFYNYKLIDKTLSEWLSSQQYSCDEIILVHGDGNGTDRIADQWAKYNCIKTEPHPAPWKRYGPAAGPMRNEEIIESEIDYAILFPGGKGTADIQKKIINSGVDYIMVLDLEGT